MRNQDFGLILLGFFVIILCLFSMVVVFTGHGIQALKNYTIFVLMAWLYFILFECR